MATKRNYLLWLVVAALVCVVHSCTSNPEERIPPTEVMHFPLTMALEGSTLAIAASSADGKFDLGRLITLDTGAIKKELSGQGDKNPIKWSSVVKTNMLIPQEVGQIVLSKSFMTFASREKNRLMAVRTQDGQPQCNDADLKVESCADARYLDLEANDPFAIQLIAASADAETFLVSYLSSDRIDLVTLDTAKKSIRPISNFSATDWIRGKLDAQLLKSRRLVTKKMSVSFLNDMSKSKAYFLLEQHPEKTPIPNKPRATIIAAIKVSDLLAKAPINDASIDIIDLGSNFSIGGAQDFYIDQDTDQAIVLGHVPEMLYKIDIGQKALLKTSVVCTEATALAVNHEKDLLVVPCFKDNRVAAYTLSTLSLKHASQVVGRGPTFVVIDKPNDLIYVTYSNDGNVLIFDENLKVQGSMLDKAPSNRIGS